ncbi:hypothetical protein, partial [Halalkalibacterium halodurans]|uniref:hypothetical protein n=1 Tax=Halalkalibacterium halodurans TaxID=86665 RepID=UPI002AAA2AFE
TFMSKTRKLLFSGLLSATVAVAVFGTVSAHVDKPEVEKELVTKTETPSEVAINNYDTSDYVVEITEEELKRDSSSLRTHDFETEEPEVEDLSQIDESEIIYLDELSDEVSTDDIGIAAVMNISQRISGGSRVVFNTQARKIENSSVSWNLVWDSRGDARIGVVGADEKFYYLNDSNGSSARTMRITKTQSYRFAIRNMSSSSATFSGWRDM